MEVRFDGRFLTDGLSNSNVLDVVQVCQNPAMVAGDVNICLDRPDDRHLYEVHLTVIGDTRRIHSTGTDWTDDSIIDRRYTRAYPGDRVGMDLSMLACPITFCCVIGPCLSVVAIISVRSRSSSDQWTTRRCSMY